MPPLTQRPHAAPGLKIPVTNDEYYYLQLGALFNVLVIAIVFHSIQDLQSSNRSWNNEDSLIALKLTK